MFNFAVHTVIPVTGTQERSVKFQNALSILEEYGFKRLLEGEVGIENFSMD